MKKYLFIAVAAVAFVFTSCKNEPKPVEPVEEEPAIELVSADSLQAFIENSDTTAISSFLTEAQEKIEQLKLTDPATAKEYLAKIQALLKENADKIKAFVGTGAVASLIDTVNSLPEIEVPDVVDEAKEAVEGAAEDVKDAATDAVDNAKEAVDNAKDAAADAVEGAKDAASNAVEGAKDAAADAVDAAADKVKGAIGK
jgi:hypothetical protein